MKVFFVVFFGIAILILIYLFMGWLYQLAWNATMPHIFNLPTLTWQQATIFYWLIVLTGGAFRGFQGTYQKIIEKGR